MHLVQASVEIVANVTRQIRLEQAPVAVAGHLVFLVNVFHLVVAHLVAGQESDGLLHVARVVSLVHRFNQLVVIGDQSDGEVSHFRVV